jgi:radical SAM superfamily enzyme YgiQ (UPF0313 family)
MKIAGYLRKFNIDSLIYDANTLKLTLEEVAKIIEKEVPRLVVFTTSTTAINSDIKVAQRVKEISQDIITATFGAHVKGVPIQTLRDNRCLDIAIYGDPETVVKELVQKNYNISEVDGIYYRKGRDIIKNKPHPPVNSLDEYGIAAHDMIEPHLYHDPLAKGSPLTITYGQIGCINKCIYCMSMLYGKLRMRSVPHFIKELKFIERLGFKEVFFIDCGFTNELKWTNELVDSMINESLNLTWWCLSRADHLNESLLRKMKRAGCHSIGVGVESANPRIIKNINKRVDTKEVIRIIKIAHKLKLRILLYFQFGLPGETRETMEETLNYALASGADLVTFGIATPVPGTPFYDYIKENGLFITSDWSKFDPALPPVYSYPNLTSDEIFEFSKKAYRAFYMRPSFVLNRLIKQRSINEIKNNCNNFIQFINRMFIAKR